MELHKYFLLQITEICLFQNSAPIELRNCAPFSSLNEIVENCSPFLCQSGSL